jgi:hypothetical protein
VPPGRCALVLSYYLGTAEADRPVPVALGECTVSAAEPQRLEFDVRGLLPGTVRILVTLDGLPLRDAEMFLRRRGDGPAVSLRANGDREGRVEALLPPGTWSANLALQAVPGPGWNMLPLPQRWEVRANDETAVTLAARMRTLRICLLDEAGAPLVGWQARVDRAGTGGFFRPGGLVTDGDGWLELSPAPYGPFHLLVRPGDAAGRESERKIGPLELAREVDRDEVEVRIGR